MLWVVWCVLYVVCCVVSVVCCVLFVLGWVLYNVCVVWLCVVFDVSGVGCDVL